MSEPTRLHPDDLEQLAERVAELVREQLAIPAPPALDADRLLTADEVASVLRVTARYVLRLGREGVLERIKRDGGKTVLFPESAVHRYLEHGRQASVPIGLAARLNGTADMPASPVRVVRRRERLR